MTKKEVRKQVKARRQLLSEAEIETMSLDIANQALTLDIWQLSMYHLFLPIVHQKEVNTQYLLQILQGKDKNVVVPKSNFEDASMSHYLLTDQTLLIPNPYGIPEPRASEIAIQENQIDVVFVPLLACDRVGQRIGYGKGFYDRFLNKCRPDVIKIGLSFFEPFDDLFKKDSYDVGLDFLLTPSECFKFENS